jgi:3-phosphoshikimate 1-carboxyvinyltransferase
MVVSVTQSKLTGTVRVSDEDVGSLSDRAVLISNLVVAGAVVASDSIEVEYETFENEYILEIMESLGCQVRHDREAKVITVSSSRLTGSEIDISPFPDIFPAAVVLATVADGSTTFSNIEKPRSKDPDWVTVMATQLDSLGSNVADKGSTLTIHGGGESILRGTTVDCKYDPYLAIALTTAGLIAFDGTVIEGGDSIDERFPTFIDYLLHLNADVTMDT